MGAVAVVVAVAAAVVVAVAAAVVVAVAAAVVVEVATTQSQIVQRVHNKAALESPSFADTTKSEIILFVE